MHGKGQWGGDLQELAPVLGEALYEALSRSLAGSFQMLYKPLEEMTAAMFVLSKRPPSEFLDALERINKSIGRLAAALDKPDQLEGRLRLVEGAWDRMGGRMEALEKLLGELRKIPTVEE